MVCPAARTLTPSRVIATPVGAVCDRPFFLESGLQARNTSLLASPQGGVAERPIKCREASADRSAGVVFRFERKENHPVCAQLRRLRDILLMGAATPPCCGAR